MPKIQDNTNVRSLITAATGLVYANGCSVIPIRADGTKKPAGTWKAFQSERPTLEDLERWFGSGRDLGLGLVLGAVSGNLEMTELEGRVFDENPNFLDQLEGVMRFDECGELFDRLANGWVETSPSGGLHWFYRLADGPVPGNTKVARRPGAINEATGKPVPDVYAETRGEGGYAVVAPTGGAVHHTGRPWQVIGDGPKAVITLTIAERDCLHGYLFDLLDTWEASEWAHPERPKAEQAPRTTADERNKVYGPGESPADHFDRVAEWADLLEGAGWSFSKADPDGARYWLRPQSEGLVGADWSASTNRDGLNNLWVWSESAGLPTNERIGPTMFRALTETGGDFGAMVRKLRAEGFGEPMERHEGFTADELNDLNAACSGKADGGDADARPSTSPPSSSRVELGKTGQSRMAHRFAGLAKGRFLHTHETRWLYWDGRRWAEDKGEKRVRRAFRAMLDLAWAEAIDDPKGLGKDVRLCHSANGEKGALDVAATIADLSCEVDDLDADPDLLNCTNGVLDLRTGELVPHDPGFRLTHIARGNFDETAPAPTWSRFLDKSLPDLDVRGFLQRFAGQALRGRDKEQKLVIMTGGGSNGKSVFVEAMQFALGDYAMVGRPEMLLATRPGAFDGSERLRGVRWATFSEIEKGQELGVAMVKRLTGTETITASVKHKPDMSFRPSHSLVLVVNDLPHIPDTGHAIWRRVAVVPWGVTIGEDEQDDQLGRKLEAEADAVFTWAVRGLMEYKRRGLDTPAAVSLATQSYRAESDDLTRFISECTIRAGGQRMTSSDLTALYEQWANLERMVNRLGPKALIQELKTRGKTLDPPLTQDRRRQWIDLAMRPNWQAPED